MFGFAAARSRVPPSRRARWWVVGMSIVFLVLVVGALLLSGRDEKAGTTTPFPPPGALFGFNEGPQVDGVTPAQLAELADIAGATSIRFPVDWRVVEPNRDAWNESGWAYYAEAYGAALAEDLTPVINFGFAPQWARDPGAPQACMDFFACRYPPSAEMDDEWTEFASEVAKRFPDAVLEVWNEPNLAIFWRPRPDPKRFAELQALAYEAIKARDDSILVLAGGLAAIQPSSSSIAPGGRDDVALRDFLSAAYDASPSIAESMDALSLHPYALNGETGSGSAFDLAFLNVREETTAQGDGGRPLWVTETGVPSTGDLAVTEAEQMDALLELYDVLNGMSDVDGIFIHRLLPPPTEAIGSTEHGYALIRAGSPYGSPKPAFCALVALAGNSYEGC